MAFPLLYFVLCHVHFWIGCHGNFTAQTETTVSEYGLDEDISSTSPEDAAFLTTYHYPSAPRPSALDKILSLAKEPVVDDDLPEDANDVLAVEGAGKNPNADGEEKSELFPAEKCQHGDSDCSAQTDDPPPDSTEPEEEKKKEDAHPEKTATPVELITKSTVAQSSGTTYPSTRADVTSPESTITGSLDLPTSFPGSAAAASENLIPLESPVAGRKDAHSDGKEVTASLSHEEKVDAGKSIRVQQDEGPDGEQVLKTNLTPSPQEADDKNVGIKNDFHDSHVLPGRQGHDNQIHSPAVEFTKSVEVHVTPKDITKEPPIKIPEEPKKAGHPIEEPTKYIPPSTTQLHSTETDFEKTENVTSVVSNPENDTSSTIMTPIEWSVVPTEYKEPTSSTLASSSPVTPSSTAHEEKPPASSTTVHSVPSPPEWITNRTCSQVPVCVRVHVAGSMCSNDDGKVELSFRKLVVNAISRYLHDDIHPARIVVHADCEAGESKHEDSSFVFFLTDPSGEYEEDLTSIAGILLRRMAKRSKGTNSSPLKILSARIVEKEDGEDDGNGESSLKETAHTAVSPPPPFVVSHNSGMIAAVAISAVAGACLCLLCLLMVVMKQRLAAQQQQLQHVNGNRPPNGLDAYSLDSFSINASFRRRRPGRCSAGSFTNHGFVGDSDDMALLSKRMSAAALSALLKNHKNIVEEEFQKIPMNMPKPREVPPGAEVKNRYVNVVPNPKTRVILADNTDDPVKTYINANYVRGHDNRPSFYIACQSPLAEYVEDFWKMVWEQQSRVIIMLTMLEENGIRRCAPYFPESTLECRQLHGDYQVTLLKKDVREFYTLSTFKLYCIEKNLFREIRHFWYTVWPAVGVPNDPMSLVTFLLQARPFMNCNSGPTIVHCSAGTGRTGTVIALDRCMREYEESRTMDIVQCVAQIRRDRGGAVQNKQQYLLIHEAMMEYASYTANQSNRASIQSNELEYHPQSPPQKKS